MQFGRAQNRSFKRLVIASSDGGLRIAWVSGLAIMAGLVLVTGAAGPAQNSAAVDPNKPYLIPEANRLPDKNDQMQMSEEKTKVQNFEAANAERKKQIAEDSTKLLTLAMSLKAEVDKTDKDTLSLNVIRKADEIEKLAHIVKEKMKLTVGAG